MTKRILVVDDDDIYRSEFRECFEEYGVVEASDGKEALAILKKPNEVDLVVLDVRMSGMGGIETLTRIRKICPGVRVVMLTGSGSKDVAIEALRGQADDYLEKPLDIEAARKIFEKYVGKKRGQPEDDAIGIREKMKKVENYLERNALKKVFLEDAAAVVCMSPKYLSRVFKEHTGKGFNDCKLAFKIEAAKQLLRDTGYKVNQIAYKLGYENPESFIRQFKSLSKLTPSRFRKKSSARKKKP